jgi:hypothetical protein
VNFTASAMPERFGVARHRGALAVARAEQAHVGHRGAQRRYGLEHVEHAPGRVEAAEEEHEVGLACRGWRVERHHRIRHAGHLRPPRHAAHPGAQRFARHHDAGSVLEEESQRMPSGRAGVLVKALEPRAVQAAG